MLAELLLIVDLLNSPSFRSTPVKQVTPPPQAVKHTVGSGASLGGALDFVGQITEIKQPVIIPPLTPQEIATAYTEAAVGKPEPIAKRIATGRL